MNTFPIQLSLLATYESFTRKILVTVKLDNFDLADYFIHASSILLDGSAGCSIVKIEVFGASEVQCQLPCYAWSASIDPTYIRRGESISNTFNLATFCDLTDISPGAHTVQFSTSVFLCSDHNYITCIGKLPLVATAIVNVLE